MSTASPAGQDSPSCPPGCITITDYQSESTPLMFSRSYNPSLQKPSLQTAGRQTPRWRHRYEIRLTQSGDDRIVFDHHGNRHRFTRNSDGSYAAADNTQGLLVNHGGQYRWTDKDEIQHRFHGSLPVSMHFPDDQSLTLHYQQGVLAFVSDDENQRIQVIHENGAVAVVPPSASSLPELPLLNRNSDPCSPLSPSSDSIEPSSPSDSDSDSNSDADPSSPAERCDTEANPVTGFLDIDTPPGVTTLDARPASCQSYFVEYYGTLRGEQIEAGLEDHLPYAAMVPTTRSFPIVDFINGNELIVVRSRDLGSPSYNNPDSPDALLDRLLRDAQQIRTRFLDPLETDGSVSASENGETTLITYSEQQNVTLHLLIRQDMASPDHWRQIESARLALAERYGISLQVVIIP